MLRPGGSRHDDDGTPYLYVGLAGGTAPGRPMPVRPLSHGRRDDRWELVTRGLPEAPAIRAIAAASRPSPRSSMSGRSTARIGRGPRRALGAGRYRGSRPAGLVAAVRSRDPDVLYAGYENCGIFRSEDGGDHWRPLPVTVRFPEITVSPRRQSGQAGAEAGRQPGDPTRSTARSRSAGSSAASTAASTGRT